MADYLTTSQAATLLGISPGRVRQLVADGRLPSHRVGHYNLIDRTELEAFRASDWRKQGKRTDLKR